MKILLIAPGPYLQLLDSSWSLPQMKEPTVLNKHNFHNHHPGFLENFPEQNYKEAFMIVSLELSEFTERCEWNAHV